MVPHHRNGVVSCRLLGNKNQDATTTSFQDDDKENDRRVDNPGSPSRNESFFSLARFSSSSMVDTARDLEPSGENPPLGVEEDDDDDFATWIQGLTQWPFTGGARANPEEATLILSPRTSEPVVVQDPEPENFFLTPLFRLLSLLAFGDPNNKDDNKDVDKRETNPLNPTGALQVRSSQEELILSSSSNNHTLTTNTSSSGDAGVEEWGAWESMMEAMQQSLKDLRGQRGTGPALTRSAELLLKQAAVRLEALLVDADNLGLSPLPWPEIIQRAAQTLPTTSNNNNSNNSSISSTTTNDLVPRAEKMAWDRGLDVRRAAEETAAYAASLVAVADRVLRRGYVAGDPIPSRAAQNLAGGLDQVPTVADSKPLFAAFSSAQELNVWTPALAKAAEMSALAGAIYEETLPRTLALGHAIVAQGMTQDIRWMVTDSLAQPASFQDDTNGKPPLTSDREPWFVRTITIRGFDASDEEVDREKLVIRVSTSIPEPVKVGKGVLMLHSGLAEMARAIYQDLKIYLDWTTPKHKIVLNGHSIGGSLSLLVLIYMTMDRGVDYVKNRIARVYTYGSPPICFVERPSSKEPTVGGGPYRCDVLELLDLPPSLAQGFVQPWDPVVRLFTTVDPLYPLVDDLGEDGVTPWINGPPRRMRPIAKAILSAWTAWPQVRDNYKSMAWQRYVSVGIQHLFLPDATRYLADRFLSVNIAVPPVATILRISSRDMFPALDTEFELDEFEISFIPQAIRSFVHHFYPAYGRPLADYVDSLKKMEREFGAPTTSPSQKVLPSPNQAAVIDRPSTNTTTAGNGLDPSSRPVGGAPGIADTMQPSRNNFVNSTQNPLNLAAQWFQQQAAGGDTANRLQP